MTWINLQRDRCGKEPFLSESQSQEARRFSWSLKRLWIYLIDNLITVEHSRVETERGNKRNERKPACCRGYICWKDLLACQPGAFTLFKDTHSLSHTLTQWARGYSSTCQSKQREQRKYNRATQQTAAAAKLGSRKHDQAKRGSFIHKAY